MSMLTINCTLFLDSIDSVPNVLSTSYGSVWSLKRSVDNRSLSTSLIDVPLLMVAFGSGNPINALHQYIYVESLGELVFESWILSPCTSCEFEAASHNCLSVDWTVYRIVRQATPRNNIKACRECNWIVKKNQSTRQTALGHGACAQTV